MWTAFAAQIELGAFLSSVSFCILVGGIIIWRRCSGTRMPRRDWGIRGYTGEYLPTHGWDSHLPQFNPESSLLLPSHHHVLFLHTHTHTTYTAYTSYTYTPLHHTHTHTHTRHTAHTTDTYLPHTTHTHRHRYIFTVAVLIPRAA